MMASRKSIGDHDRGLGRIREENRPSVTPVIASLNEVINQFLPQGHEKLIRNALFNTITFCLILLVLVTLVAVYFILEPFLRPLLWALLLGSVLFPFKQKLTRVTRRWLNQIKESNNSVTIESISLPLKISNWIMDSVIDIMMDYAKLLVAIFVSLLSIHLLIYYFTVTHRIIQVVSFLCSMVTQTFVWLQSPAHTMVINATAMAHVSLIAFFWTGRQGTQARKPFSLDNFLIASSPFIWISVFCQLLSFLGPIGWFIVMSLVFLAVVGVTSAVMGWHDFDSSNQRSRSKVPSSDLQADSTDSQTNKLATVSADVVSPIKSVSRWILWLITCLLPSHLIKNFYFHTSLDESEDHIEDDLDEQEATDVTDCQESIPSPEKEDCDKTQSLQSSPMKSSIQSPLSTRSEKSVGFFGRRKPKHHHYREEAQISNVYIYALLWTCCLAYVWLNPQILLILPVPLVLLSLRWMWNRFFLPDPLLSLQADINIWFEQRKDALVHPILRHVFQYLRLGDKTMAQVLGKSLDTLCSLSVIIFVLVGMILAAAFLTFQIYGESIHLVNVCGNIVNATLTNNPEFTSLFSDNNSTTNSTDLTFLDEMIGNAYFYGRKWLKKTIRSVLNVGPDEASLNASIAIEKQLLEVWDRSYQMWLSRDKTEDASQDIILDASQSGFIKPKHIHNSSDYNWNTLLDALKTLNFGLCFNVLKENVDTVFSVLESVWMILKGNLSIMFSIVTAITSLLLSGSSALLNGALNFIVFSTSLFYLLCASDDQYKPIEWASSLLPSSNESSTRSSSLDGRPFYTGFEDELHLRRQNKFVRAFNEGINSVFAASFKMATFYGLYTWLIHTLFQARLVYIPSVTAALLGAVPFIGSYWASIPAVLELWLVHSLGWKSLLMLTCCLFPTYVVDSAIYAEIKGGGHPYLTGLAIAGGVFFLGFEGAIFGPILLCCLFVAVNIYTSIMNENDDNTPSIGSRRRQFKRMNSTIS
jgi:predicted PurR-regulated permease PerM